MIPLPAIEAAAALIHRTLGPTPQIPWPLLARRCGCDVWVKHEGHLPTGAFKVRGGLVYLDRLRREQPDDAGRQRSDALKRQSRASGDTAAQA